MCRHSKPDDTSETMTSGQVSQRWVAGQQPGDQLDKMDQVDNLVRYLLRDRLAAFVQDYELGRVKGVSHWRDEKGQLVVQVPELGVTLHAPLWNQLLWQLSLASLPREERLYVDWKH